MKFKHSFNVFIDNFSVTYKQLLYRLVVLVVAWAICFAGIYPFIKNDLLNSPSFLSLTEGIKNFLKSLIYGNVEELRGISEKIRTAYSEFITLLQNKTGRFVLSGFILLLVYLVEKWFMGLGNYATAAVVNDKMALRTNSPFIGTLIRNLKEACIYNLMYVPLSILYDLIIGVALFFIIFYLVNSILPFFFCLFLFVVLYAVSTSFKMTFTADWLPALIRGKMSQTEAFVYTFRRKNKKTMDVFSNFVVLTLLFFGLNVASAICTLGVGLLLTIPSSYVLLISFEFVNYYDREEIKYFLDKNTVVKPEREHTPTREEFFRGENDR